MARLRVPIEGIADEADIAAMAFLMWVQCQRDTPPERHIFWATAHPEERQLALTEAADLLGYAF